MPITPPSTVQIRMIPTISTETPAGSNRASVQVVSAMKVPKGMKPKKHSHRTSGSDQAVPMAPRL